MKKQSNSAASACATEKKCCWVTLFKGALVGAVIMFFYMTISWTVIPWHKNTVFTFKNEGVVASALAKNAVKSGVYVLHPNNAGVSKPFAFVAVSMKGAGAKSMASQLYGQLLLCLLIGALLTKLLKKTSGSCCPVLLSMLVGLLAASAHHLPNLIWFRFPWNYTVVGMLDDFLSITLAGLFISKIVLGAGDCTMAAGSCSVAKCDDKK